MFSVKICLFGSPLDGSVIVTEEGPVVLIRKTVHGFHHTLAAHLCGQTGAGAPHIGLDPAWVYGHRQDTGAIQVQGKVLHGHVEGHFRAPVSIVFTHAIFSNTCNRC